MIKKTLFIFVLTWCLSKNIEAQVPTIGDSLQLEIANWNLNWLGKIGYGPSNETLQQNNIIDVIKKSEIDWLSDLSRIKELEDYCENENF